MQVFPSTLRGAPPTSTRDSVSSPSRKPCLPCPQRSSLPQSAPPPLPLVPLVLLHRGTGRPPRRSPGRPLIQGAPDPPRHGSPLLCPSLPIPAVQTPPPGKGYRQLDARGVLDRRGQGRWTGEGGGWAVGRTSRPERTGCPAPRPPRVSAPGLGHVPDVRLGTRPWAP